MEILDRDLRELAPAAAWQHPLLSAGTERELAREVEAGVYAGWLLAHGRRDAELAALVDRGRAAVETLFRCSLRFVARTVRPIAAQTGLPVAELFQEGAIGVIEGIHSFDYQRGTRLITWTAVAVRYRVLRAVVAGCGTSALRPYHWRQLRALHGLEGVDALSDAEVAAALGWSAGWVQRLRRAAPEEGLPAVEPVDGESESAYDGVLGRLTCRELLARLHPEEREVMWLRAGFGGRPLSRGEAGRALGLDVGRVRRLEERAKVTLRGLLTEEGADSAAC